MSTTDHADLEALSAFVDGEAPEWADHVAGCEQCRAAAARLGAVAAKVRAPVGPPPAAVRERAMTAALDEARHVAERERFARRRAPRPWAMPAAAAAVVALLAVSGVVLSANRSTEEATTTFAGPALDVKAESGVAGAAPNAPPADLGDIAGPVDLRARAGFPISSLAQTQSPDAAGAPVAGAGGSAGVAPPTTTLSQRSATPVPVGTRPCEDRVRAREPNLGPVTYFATARRGEVPAYVLGFSPVQGSVTLVLLRQTDCSEVLRSIGPALP